MTLTWCKLHTDILGDAKLLRAARKGARWLVVLPWLMAWTRAHDETDCGRLVLDGDPVEPEDVAAQLPGVSAAQVRACLASAESIGVLVRDDDGVLRFAAWDERSGKASSRPSDRPEAVRERVRKHRQTKRAHTDDTSGNAPTETRGNDGNALPNALEEEREIEREKDPATTNHPRGSVAEAANDTVRPRLPADYRPDLDALLDRVATAQRPAWLRSLAAVLDGMHGPPVTPVVLGEALRAFGANGAELRWNLFAGYLRRAAAPPPPALVPNGAPNGRPARAPAGVSGERLSPGEITERNAMRGLALAFGPDPRDQGGHP